MNFSRQVLLGIGVVFGGSVMLYAMQQQGSNPKPEQPVAVIAESATQQTSQPPLTTDIETEKRILAQKQKERALRVAEQEKRAQLFLADQESAEAQALAKSRAENQKYLANARIAAGADDSAEVSQNTITTPTVQKRTDIIKTDVEVMAKTDNNAQQLAQVQQKAAAQQQKLKEQAAAKKIAEEKQAINAAKSETPTTPTEYKVQRGDGLVKLARQNNISLAALAQANNLSPSASLQLGQTLTIPSRQQIARLERDAAIAKKAPESKPKTEVAVLAPTTPTEYKVQRGDGLVKLARQNNISLAALAQANNLSPSASLQLGQTLTIPSRQQIARLERDAAIAKKTLEDKRQKELNAAKVVTDAQQKLRDARKQVRDTGAKGNFGVQVSLARNQAAADAIAKAFKSSGYQVKTIATGRGIQVIVGPERGKIAALALKDKINSDPKLNTNGAWVRYW